jgi:hypothetical protein
MMGPIGAGGKNAATPTAVFVRMSMTDSPFGSVGQSAGGHDRCDPEPFQSLQGTQILHQNEQLQRVRG